MKLQEFLNNKPLYYDNIDYTRMPRLYKKLKDYFVPSKIIHLIGTNAKGTTGRFLASALCDMGYKVAHYSSPHILNFNERIWLNGKEVDDEILEFNHEILQSILESYDLNELSYFEYTTFLAMLIFNASDYIVLEAGLGGEFDATAVFDKILTLVTPIDFDHEAFLGSNIKDIAKTKLNSIQNNAIISKQIFKEVKEITKELALGQSINIYELNDFLEDEDRKKIEEISNNLSLVPYLTQNLSLAISALKFLKLNYEVNNFKESRLFGRLSKISNNIIIDVGHNTLAAKAILNALSPNKYILVYNSFQDKNYKKILDILKPLILYVEIIDIQNQRSESLELIQDTLKDLDIDFSEFEKVSESNQYLVFGSFSVVEAFLKIYNG
ncbi:MAG: bifunctional folylpolyglutamate synthase/dihydrofolate synthase [Sulfurimonas sp.]|nr:MAG: bifunctional folylpolyglutamate synthase/dihydrofolate synthase [Sulfurimonas sp.]